MPTYPKPSRPVFAAEDLFAAAEACYHTHGYATSLDVKRVLRARGFWAVQADVSDGLQTLLPTSGWCFSTCIAWQRRPDGSFRRDGPHLAYWPEAAPPPLVAYGEG